MAWNKFTGCHPARLTWLAAKNSPGFTWYLLPSPSVLLAFLVGWLPLPAAAAVPPENGLPVLDAAQTAWLGERIFTNECNRQPGCLTAWNTGEDFPSLGIGHFIWYRRGQDGIFAESFPALMAFMQERNQAIPAWIAANDFDAPWPDRDTFLAELDQPRLVALRAFLSDTMALQTAFIVSRFDGALAAMLASTEAPAEAERLRSNFARVAASAPPYGLYALIDYVNFKGTGVSPRETYNNHGWGLKQVLLGMNGDSAPGAATLDDFIASARQVLATRVDNAPADRNESRWLNGWHNRLATYAPTPPADAFEQ